MKKVNLQYFGKRFIYDNVILYMLTRRLQHLSSTSVFSRNIRLSEYCFVDYCSYFSALWRLYCLCLFWLYCLFLFWPLLLSSNLSYRNCEIKTSLNEFLSPYHTLHMILLYFGLKERHMTVWLAYPLFSCRTYSW
jgi:hypothetical protein